MFELPAYLFLHYLSIIFKTINTLSEPNRLVQYVTLSMLIVTGLIVCSVKFFPGLTSLACIYLTKDSQEI